MTSEWGAARFQHKLYLRPTFASRSFSHLSNTCFSVYSQCSLHLYCNPLVDPPRRAATATVRTVTDKA